MGVNIAYYMIGFVFNAHVGYPYSNAQGSILFCHGKIKDFLSTITSWLQTKRLDLFVSMRFIASVTITSGLGWE